MTNLGAGFPVGSPETTGPQLPSSSGPPSERDRYTEFRFVCFYCVHEPVGLFINDIISCVLQ